MYEGWEDDGRSCSRLLGKTLIAGMSRSEEFHTKREARIQGIYNADEIDVRVLNRDGGSWIKDPYEPETVFQLDRFHIQQCIKEKIAPPDAQKEIDTLFEEGHYDEVFEYISIYADSAERDDEKDNSSRKARELYEYLKNNREVQKHPKIELVLRHCPYLPMKWAHLSVREFRKVKKKKLNKGFANKYLTQT